MHVPLEGLQNEGYARKITFLPGWASKEEAKKIPRGTQWLVLGGGAMLPVSRPELKPEACQPGKPIQWDTSKRVYGIGKTLVPFKTHLGASPKKKEVVPEDKFGLALELELPSKLGENQPFELTWIVGNGGKEPVFVKQNSCCPGVATWSLARSGKEVSKGDFSDTKIMMDLYPAREAFLLFPGEYLSFRRSFAATELAWKAGANYELQLCLPDVCAKKQGEVEFTEVALQSTVKIRPEKSRR